MREDILLQRFSEESSGNNYYNGQRVLNNDLISSLTISEEEEILCIEGNVISENLFHEYRSKIELEVPSLHIASTCCSCEDFKQRAPKKKNYCCKHLVGLFYKAVPELTVHPLLRTSEEKGSIISSGNILPLLLGGGGEGEELKIEVYINKNNWNDHINAEFRIGLRSMGSNDLYVLKDLSQFLISYCDNVPIEYGKSFVFHKKQQSIRVMDRRLIDFIEVVHNLDKKNRSRNKIGDNYIGGKFVSLPHHLVREFFSIISEHRVYLNEGFFSRPVETEIIFSEPPIDFDLRGIKDNYVLKSIEGMPVSLDTAGKVLLFGTMIYLPDPEFCYKLEPYLKVFHQARVITIPSTEEEVVLRKLIPNLMALTPRLALSKEIESKIVFSPVEFKFYFDRVKGEIAMTAKVKYGAYEFNIFSNFEEKIIYRDIHAEKKVISTIKNLGFELDKDRFYFNKSEDTIFRFFKTEIIRLQQLGEVFYSENFKGIKYIGSNGISGTISPGKYNYFEMDFKIGDIPRSETTKILRAFRDNLKYYRLENGEYLDLEELELKKLLKLLDIVNPKNLKDNHLELPGSKAAYISDYIESAELRYLKGKSELKEISSKLKNADKQRVDIPEELQGILRDYQKHGYNWLNTLEQLGFGGILGDEMGLGKTLQIISFIMAHRGTRTLIVVPTSLIYNWTAEFERFAPEINVIGIYGTRENREDIIENIEAYEVVITTYNLLKRDIISYSELSFDHCILDEAQYIKNSHSQNALAVKKINAKTRFALTGTPIENSLMELWSIFDFIMPGYLYDEKRFSVRYHKKLHEEPEVLEELNKLIKPFILRRRKKEVLKELPDKIERQLMVSMNDQQKKVYQTYARYAVELIEKKVKEEEFEKNKIEILAYLTKLRQLCLDPSIVMQDYEGGSEKLEALMELLQEGIEEGHKILVFSQFTSVLSNIEKRISAERIAFSYLDGSVPAEKRINLVNAFNEGPPSVFLISLKAGGTGLNLTSADTVIHFDPWWNPAVENQATDRAHRIGQRKVVEVIKIIAKGTIEEKILSLQEEKKKLIDELMSEELSKGEGLNALTAEELLGLFETHS